MSGLCSFNIRTRWLVLLLFFDRRLFGIFGKLIIFYYIQKSFVFFNEFFNSILPSYLSLHTDFHKFRITFRIRETGKLFSVSIRNFFQQRSILISSKFFSFFLFFFLRTFSRHLVYISVFLRMEEEEKDEGEERKSTGQINISAF